ncbi:MAG: hypothetical protein KGR26_10070, partial [Cyanobacteria bacterium REEB65]|nr:hypothetical protein [Cyanobacteria bacterium REEB65]
ALADALSGAPAATLAFDRERRIAEIDAIVARLYGLTAADLDLVLSSFPKQPVALLDGIRHAYDRVK